MWWAQQRLWTTDEKRESFAIVERAHAKYRSYSWWWLKSKTKSRVVRRLCDKMQCIRYHRQDISNLMKRGQETSDHFLFWHWIEVFIFMIKWCRFFYSSRIILACFFSSFHLYRQNIGWNVNKPLLNDLFLVIRALL